MSKSVGSGINGELKMTVNSNIDEAFDAVRRGDLTHEDAFVALRTALIDVPGVIFTLKIDGLRRAFEAIGRKDDGPVNSKSVSLKNARILLNKIVSSNNAFSISSGNINAIEEKDGIHEIVSDSNSDRDVTDTESIDEEKHDKILSDRQSPRKNVKVGRTERVVNQESNRISKMEDEMSSVRKLLEKLVQRETDSLSTAFNSIPSMNQSNSNRVHREIVNDTNVINVAPKSPSKSVRANKKEKNSQSLIPPSVPTQFNSENDSFSSSSTASSDTDDSVSSHKSSRTKHSKRSTRSSNRSKRFAMKFIASSAKDGVLTYVNRIVSSVYTEQGKIDIRSKKEAESIANALDAFISVGVSPELDGMEVLCTRLIGVIVAMQTSDWTLATAIEYKVLGTSTLPLSSQQMARLMKQGTRIKSLTSAPSKAKNYRNGTSKQQEYDDTAIGTTPSYKKNNHHSSGQSSATKQSTAGTAAEKSSSKSQ